MLLRRGLIAATQARPTRGVGPYSNSSTIPVTSETLAQATVPITMVHTAPISSTVSSEILAANSNAKYRLIYNNDSTTPVWIKCGDTAVANEGIPIWPGKTYEMNLQLGNLDTRAINAISGQSVVLLVTEGS